MKELGIDPEKVNVTAERSAWVTRSEFGQPSIDYATYEMKRRGAKRGVAVYVSVEGTR